MIKDENPGTTAAVRAKHGDAFVYRHSIIAGPCGVALGGSAADRVDVYSDLNEDWEKRRTAYVLNGKVLEAD
jgi:hypothetical protein